MEGPEGKGYGDLSVLFGKKNKVLFYFKRNLSAAAAVRLALKRNYIIGNVGVYDTLSFCTLNFDQEERNVGYKKDKEKIEIVDCEYFRISGKEGERIEKYMGMPRRVWEYRKGTIRTPVISQMYINENMSDIEKEMLIKQIFEDHDREMALFFDPENSDEYHGFRDVRETAKVLEEKQDENGDEHGIVNGTEDDQGKSDDEEKNLDKDEENSDYKNKKSKNGNIGSSKYKDKRNKRSK